MGDWWTCPSEACDGETEVVTVRRRDEVSTTRRCTECDWSVDLPDKEWLKDDA